MKWPLFSLRSSDPRVMQSGTHRFCRPVCEELEGRCLPSVNIITGTASGGSEIRILDGDTGRVVNTITPFGGFTGGVRVAAGDLNGDNTDDIIVGVAGGGLSTVAVFNGVDGSALGSFFAFTPAYTGGVNLAAGDINGDGTDDIIVGAASGLGQVRIIDGTQIDNVNPTGEISSSALLADFFAFTTLYAGGITVASGDVNNDRTEDIIVGAATGLAQVRVIDGTMIDQLNVVEGDNEAILGDFFAFTLDFTGGVNVGAGDTNGDGHAEVIVGPRTGLAQVRVIDGANINPGLGVIDERSPALLANFFAFEPGLTDGVNVAAGDVNGDGFADIITGASTGLAHVRIFDAAGNFQQALDAFTNSGDGVFVAAGSVQPPLPSPARVIVAPATGGSLIRILEGDTGRELDSFFAFPGFTGGVRVASGDVNGDGTDDVIVGAAIGLSHVRVINGSDGSSLGSFFAFNQGYRGGVNVAAGDVNNDGKDDIIVGAATGLGQVRVIDGNVISNGNFTGEISSNAIIADFFAFTLDYTGGITVASGDVNNDRTEDIIVGAATGLAHVRVIDGTMIDQLNVVEADSGALLGDFFAFTLDFQGGVNVGAGDTNGDGHAEVIVGARTGLAHVRVIDGSNIDPGLGIIEDTSPALLANFFAFTQSYTGGVNVAAGDVNGDGFADIITGASTGLAQVRMFDAGGNLLNEFDPLPGFDGGVFVAGGTPELVSSPLQSLNLIRSQVPDLGLSRGLTSLLTRRLDAAVRELERGNQRRFDQHINLFVRYLQVLHRAGRIEANVINELIPEFPIVGGRV